MKQVLSVASLVGLALTKGLNIGFNNSDNGRFNLQCEGAYGTVVYNVENLPAGVTFEGNTIVVSASAAVGVYQIRIRAVDELGQSVERVISLEVGVAGGANGANGANGGVNGGANGGLNGGNGGVAPGGNGGVAPGGNGGVAPGGNGGVAPGGNGNFPGGNGSGPATNPADSGRLSSIISAYSTTTDVVRPNYGNSGRYPEPDFPTGPTQPSGPNPTVLDINNNQARPSDANRNPVSPADVLLRAASDRQQNAAKGIANLLSIIDQANANKNKAQSDIQTYTQAYNDAITNQRAAQNAILAAETRTSQIVSAINTLTNTISDLTNKINQAVAARDGLNARKTTTLATITTLEGQRGALNNQLKGYDNQLSTTVQKLSDQKSQCSSLNDSINAKQADIAAKQNDLATATAARAGVVADINGKAGIVDDLRNRLQQAERDLADAKIRLAGIDAQIASLPGQIAGLQRDLTDLIARAKACADQVATIQATIDNIKNKDYIDLTNKIAGLDGEITTARTTVSDIDAQLAASQGPLEELKAKLAQAQQDLAFIKSQKTDADAALRLAYQRGNDANNRVAFAKQNLDAIIKRFQDESRIVSDANLNLERARAEQQLASQAVEELIAKYANVLPYSIVPNGNGRGSGTPFGNNPSGSALGPIRTGGNGAPGSFRVSNWSNYLSTAYGNGVSPAVLGSVNELFPFNFLSGTTGVNGNIVNNNYVGIRGDLDGGRGGVAGGAGGAGGCFARNAGQTERVTQGTVVAVRVGSFDLRDTQGQVQTVRVAPCTKLNANKPDYILETGHQAVAKGYDAKEAVFTIDATQVTCVQ